MKVNYNFAEYEAEWETDRAGRTFTMKYAAMYDTPERDEKTLDELREHFGAERVYEADTIKEPGCETCDYYSLYGWELRIVNPTLNLPEDNT